jgi:hypothetical protein
MVASLTVLLERIDTDSKCRSELAARLHETQHAAAGSALAGAVIGSQRDVVLALLARRPPRTGTQGAFLNSEIRLKALNDFAAKRSVESVDGAGSVHPTTV